MQSFHKEHIGNAELVLGDAAEYLKAIPDNSFDLAIADPPYGAASKGQWKLSRDHALSGMGGEWKLADHKWDMFCGVEGFEFTIAWLSQLGRIVKPTGSLFLHGTYHNIGLMNVACQILKLEIINEIVWYKRNAFPNLAARRLTASHESILWVHTGTDKRNYRFNYDDAKAAAFPEDELKAADKQMRTVWDIPNNKSKEELMFGQHPTQKPVRLIERLLLIAGLQGGKCLVPFMGSGSEMVACLRWGMKPVGLEIEPEFFEIAARRIRKQVEMPQQESMFESGVTKRA
jgi:site-specific DNA-methyltransferase (adenine-specific)